MLDTIPNEEEMTALIGQSLYDVWNKLCILIDHQFTTIINSAPFDEQGILRLS